MSCLCAFFSYQAILVPLAVPENSYRWPSTSMDKRNMAQILIDKTDKSWNANTYTVCKAIAPSPPQDFFKVQIGNREAEHQTALVYLTLLLCEPSFWSRLVVFPHFTHQTEPNCEKPTESSTVSGKQFTSNNAGCDVPRKREKGIERKKKALQEPIQRLPFTLLWARDVFLMRLCPKICFEEDNEFCNETLGTLRTHVQSSFERMH